MVGRPYDYAGRFVFVSHCSFVSHRFARPLSSRLAVNQSFDAAPLNRRRICVGMLAMPTLVIMSIAQATLFDIDRFAAMAPILAGCFVLVGHPRSPCWFLSGREALQKASPQKSKRWITGFYFRKLSVVTTFTGPMIPLTCSDAAS
jgi:hypothetical protein